MILHWHGKQSCKLFLSAAYHNINKLKVGVLMLLGLKRVIFLGLVVAFSPLQAETVTPADIKPQILPVDSDNDGVIDDIDKCYKTPAGTQVDERGCAIVISETKEITLNIIFDFDSALVKQEYYSEIERVAEFMRKYPTTRVIIEGHSDSDGPASYNKRLSGQRAQATARVLVNTFGITADRVTAIGFGEERPLVKNDSDANKALNRRVVALIRSVKESRG